MHITRRYFLKNTPLIFPPASGILYTVRSQTESFTPRVYAPGQYTVKAGKDKPDAVMARAVEVP